MRTPASATSWHARIAALLALTACRASRPRGTTSTSAPALTQPAAPYEDVASYTMTATLSDSHRAIDGEATIVWHNRSARPIRELWWHLYMNAFDGPGTLFMRTGGLEGHRGHAPGERGSIRLLALSTEAGDDLLAGATDDPAVADDHTQLLTPLPREVAPGDTLTLHARFRTTLPHAFARTGFDRDFVFAGQWFPKLAVLESDGRWEHFPFHFNTEFYADFGHYDVTLDVPRGDVVGATGRAQGRREASGERARVRFVASRVHDFAWTAWSQFRALHAVAGGIALTVLHPPGERRVADRCVAALSGAIPDFARRYGVYPYPNLTIVIPPRGAAGVGGMEYPTLITADGAWFTPDGVRDVEWVAIHEFAHQYFYGVVASDEWAWPFLDEGLAEYATGVAMSELYGLDREVVDLAGVRIGFWALQAAASGAIDDALPVALGASQFPTESSYGLHVYRRAATVFRTAANVWGDDAVARALALYASRGRFGHPRPEALLDAFRETLGNDVADGYLRPALFGDASLDNAVTRVDARGVALEHHGAIAMPVDVTAIDANGHAHHNRWTAAASRQDAAGPGAPSVTSVSLDPDQRVLLDRSRLDDARAASGEAGGTASIRGEIAWWIATALRSVGP